MSNDIQIRFLVYKQCDEYTMTVGNTYLVHSTKTGLFLGTYEYASRSLGSYIFSNCKFYEKNYYGDIVLSDCPHKDTLAISMADILVRECK
jgi:hypothetical protein